MLLLAFLLSSCSLEDLSGPADQNRGRIYSIDKNFKNYYKQLGGKEMLGVGISEVITWDDHQCQYTEKVLMCFNEAHSQDEGYFLFPLGAMLSIQNQPSSIPEIGIYSAFETLYKNLGGENTVGKPITTLQYNFQEDRIEQYYENIGFYQLFNDQSEVGLLSYGVFTCENECDFSPAKGTAVLFHAEVVSLPFMKFISRFQELDALGEPLTDAIELQPGLIQQVYKNAALIGNPSLPETIHLLDLPVKLNYRQETPGPQIYSIEDNMVFYVVNSPNGFHVPIVFDDFITKHGGRELSGYPLCEVYQEGNNFRQCFQNFCLDYFPDSKEVKMVALGEEYMQIAQMDNLNIVQFEYSPETVSLIVKEKSAHITLDEEQEIEILVLKTSNQSPLQNVEASLQINLPNGNTSTYVIPATDEFGTSTITIPTNKRVSNGDVITYFVCLDVPSEEPICVKDSYLIW